jgi:hypothetical protein
VSHADDPSTCTKMAAFLSHADDPSLLESSTREALACPGSLAARGGLGVIAYTCTASSEACAGAARNLSARTRKTRWTGTKSGDEVLVFALAEHCMINYLEIDSNTVGRVEVHTAAVNRRGRYAVARPGMVLPQGRKFRCRLGFLPCKFIKLVCRNPRGRPGQSIFSVRIVGMRGSGVQLGLGPRMHNMLMTETERNIYTTRDVARLDEANPVSFETISEINVESEASDDMDEIVDEIVAEETQRGRDGAPQRITVEARVPSSNEVAFVASAVASTSLSSSRLARSQRDNPGPFMTSYASKSPSRKTASRSSTRPEKRAKQRAKKWQAWNARGRAAVEGSLMRQAQARGERSAKLGIHAHLKAIYGAK